MTTELVTTFDQLQLTAPVLQAVRDLGYETPTPIQAQTIPLMLAGRDVLGQAQTGTGKTAAFALPVLCRLNLALQNPQVLVLAPTRELAIQVAEAFQTYASHIKGFHVLPVYGGQDYSGQIRALKRGVHIVVGTPGRVMDHMRKGTLKLHELTTLVLDEADEMLRMGFIDDVEWILEQTPPKRQIALFSATMPAEVRRIANQHLHNPEQITIQVKKATADLIRQRFWPVSGVNKLDALTRILEAETFDGMIVFVRTRIVTIELAEKLSARGFAATALNGDIPQAQRERTIDQLKKGKLDILVATDVAARGLDVDRISHVINYDIPYDEEAYIHRIGRTGRAGRRGDAILFVAPRERRMLGAIERTTGSKIEMMELPSTELINDKRIAQFKQAITDTLGSDGVGQYSKLIEEYQQEYNVPALEIAAALAKLAQGNGPLLLQNKPAPKVEKNWGKDVKHGEGFRHKERGPRNEHHGDKSRGEGSRPIRKDDGFPDKGMERFRIEVGHAHRVMPGNIVGAIANEAGLDSKDIGRINIYDDYSTIDLPIGMPEEIFKDLKKIWVVGKTLNISRIGDKPEPGKPREDKFARKSKPRENTQSFSGKKHEKLERHEKREKPREKSKSRPPIGAAEFKPKKKRAKDTKNIGKRRVPKTQQ